MVKTIIKGKKLEVEGRLQKKKEKASHCRPSGMPVNKAVR